MSKNKNKLRRTLALTASVAIMGTSIPFNVLAEGGQNSGFEIGPEIGVHSNVKASTTHKWKKYSTKEGHKITKITSGNGIKESDNVPSDYTYPAVGESSIDVNIGDDISYFANEEDLKNGKTSDLHYLPPRAIVGVYPIGYANRFYTNSVTNYHATYVELYYEIVKTKYGMPSEDELMFDDDDATVLAIYRVDNGPIKDKFIESTSSSNRNMYPDNGEQNGYWYEYEGATTITDADEFIPSTKTLFCKKSERVNLKTGLTNAPTGATVTVTKDVNTSTVGEKTGQLTVKFSDGSTKVVPIKVNVIATQADTFVPEVTEEEVTKGGEADLTDNIDNLPEGSTVEEKEAPNTDEPGKTTGTVEVTFPDGSTKEVEIPVKVVEKAGTITPVPEINKDDIEKEVVPWGGEVDLTDNIKNLPEGSTVEDVTDPAIDTKKSGDYTGKVKVTFEDGSSRVVDVPVEVEKSMADTFTPEVTEEEVTKGGEVDLTDNIDNLPEGSTVEEKEKPNTDEPGKTKGTVEVTFPDGSTKEVEIPVKVKENKSDVCEDTEPLKKKIEELEKELQDEKDKNKDLEDKIKNQEDKNKDLDDKIKDLEDQKKDLEDKLDQEKAKTEQDQDKIKELEDKIADLEKQIEDLKKEKGELEKELEDLKGKLGDKDKEITDKDKEIEELKKLLEEAKKKSEEKPVVEDKKPSKEDKKPNITNNNNNNNNINIDLGRNNFEREHHRRHRNRLPFEIVYERETPRYTRPAYTGHGNYQENRLEYIFTIGSTVYQRIMGAKTENRSMDVAPYIKNDRTMLPLRYVAEAIGAEVRWDNTTRTAYFTKDGVTAKIQIDGNKIEMSDGRIFEMDSKPDNIKGRIFVSLTNVSKVFNLTNGNTEDGINQQIEWNRHNKQVSISLNR